MGYQARAATSPVPGCLPPHPAGLAAGQGSTKFLRAEPAPGEPQLRGCSRPDPPAGRAAPGPPQERRARPCRAAAAPLRRSHNGHRAPGPAAGPGGAAGPRCGRLLPPPVPRRPPVPPARAQPGARCLTWGPAPGPAAALPPAALSWGRRRPRAPAAHFRPRRRGRPAAGARPPRSHVARAGQWAGRGRRGGAAVRAAVGAEAAVGGVGGRWMGERCRCCALSWWKGVAGRCSLP